MPLCVAALCCFFQAEDGIRDGTVTGVQTCALPISLHAPHVALTGPTDGTLQVFRVIRAIQDEIGVAAASTYIVSRTRSADDLLRVLLLAREGGLGDRLDIVPLFETLEDLEQAPLVVRSLLADPIWQRHLAARGRHQEVMLGYSDSAKDA